MTAPARAARRLWAVAALAVVAIAPAGAAHSLAEPSPTSGAATASPAAPTTPSLGSAALWTASKPLNTSDRDAIERAYLHQYLAPTESLWDSTADPGSCTPGQSYGVAPLVASTINFARAMAGLDPVTVDPIYGPQLQRTGLMMAAANSLSHYPDPSWPCYSPEGAEGAATSNLALGVAGPGAVEAYLDDFGSHNYTVGHRRWILDPFIRSMGTGDVGGSVLDHGLANALKVIDTPREKTATDPGVVRWPTAGYFPRPLLPTQEKRWSVSNSSSQAPATYDFTDAAVTVSSQAGPVPVAVTYRDLDVVVFTPDLAEAESETGDITRDTAYTVTLTGLTDPETGDPVPDLTHTVTLFTPRPAYEFTSEILGEAYFGQTLTAGEPWDWETDEPVGADGVATYEWVRLPEMTPLGTGRTYQVRPADLDHRIGLTVRLTNQSGLYAIATDYTWLPVSPDEPPTNLVAPKLSGRVSVDQAVHVSDGRWSDDAVDITYEWLVDGAPIRGQYASVFVPSAVHLGRTVWARVTYKSEGRPVGVAVSNTAVVGKGRPPKLVGRPVIAGTLRIGAMVGVSGRWGFDMPARVAYQWLRDGHVIPRAHAMSYRLKRADRGKAVSLRVTGTRPGHARGTYLIRRTGTVAR